MKAISPKHMYIWMLFAASALFGGRASAQNVDFSWGTSVMGVPAERAYRNVEKINDDYVYIKDADTLNLSRFYRRYGMFKHAAEYLRNNRPPVEHDTVDITQSLVDGGFFSGRFFANPNYPEKSKIILYHYMAGYKQYQYIKQMEQKLENATGREQDSLIREIAAAKERQTIEEYVYEPYVAKSLLEGQGVFWHEYKHYLNRILLYENMNNMTRNQIVLFNILDELTADIQGRLMSDEKHTLFNTIDDVQRYLVAVIRKSYSHIMNYADDFQRGAKTDMNGYYYQKPTDKNLFKNIVAEMLQFYVDETNTINLYDVDGIINMAKKTPFYKKITKEIAHIGNTNRFAKAFATGGEDAYNKEVEAMIKIAKKAKEQE